MQLRQLLEPCDKNQIITNMNYDQNSLSIFFKTINNQIQVASDKTYTKNDCVVHNEKIMGFFP